MLALALALAACTRFHAQPIDVPATLDALESRTLADSGLIRFLRTNEKAGSWPPTAWNLHALTLAALYFNPDLSVARVQWNAARAAIMSAGERPNPGVSVAQGKNVSTPASTITPWILTLDLDFTVTTAGKRGRRIAQAKHLAEAARFDIASTAWAVRSAVRRNLLELFGATNKAALLEQQQSIHRRNVALLERQLEAGAISPFELSQARLLLGTNRLALDDARQRQAEARVALAGAIGITARALTGAPLSFDEFEQAPSDLPTSDVRRQALLNRPDILSALQRYEARQSALQLEIARQYPDIHLGPGYQMDQNATKWTLALAGALPVLSRNRGLIAEADARRDEAAASFTSVQNRAIEQIDGALAAHQAALAKLATANALYAERLELLRRADAQFAAGEISRLQLGSIQLEVASSEEARLDGLVNLHQTIGRIEEAMQRPAVIGDWIQVGASRGLPANQP